MSVQKKTPFFSFEKIWGLFPKESLSKRLCAQSDRDFGPDSVPRFFFFTFACFSVRDISSPNKCTQSICVERVRLWLTFGNRWGIFFSFSHHKWTSCVFIFFSISEKLGANQFFLPKPASEFFLRNLNHHKCDLVMCNQCNSSRLTQKDQPFKIKSPVFKDSCAIEGFLFLSFARIDQTEHTKL